MTTKKEHGPEQKNLKFEDALKRLEKIVEKMEAGAAPLEESLALYEEGIALFRFCSAKLEEAKKKVEILTKKSSDGKFLAEPFSAAKFSGGKEDSESEDAGEKIPF